MTNYKETLNLPKTGFAMKANLANREPAMIKRWEDEGGPANDAGPISDHPTLRDTAMAFARDELPVSRLRDLRDGGRWGQDAPGSSRPIGA